MKQFVIKEIDITNFQTIQEVIDYLENELDELDAKITNSKEIISKFKQYFFELYANNENINK